MKNYNIFIASSPLQLLNCIEASHHFQTKNNILLLIQTSEKSNLFQMNKLLDKYRWDQIKYISLPETLKHRIMFTNTIKRTLEYFKKHVIGKVFVGEYRSDNITHIVNYLDANEVYLVDDGLALLNYDKNINQKSNKQKIRAIIYKLFSYKLSIINFKFFTIFDLKQDSVIKNKYTYIKQYMEEKSTDPSVFFIAQPLVELSMISENNYKIELKKVIDFYKNKQFVFILHRRQKEKIIKKLALELGFEYKLFDQLIELEMLNSSTIPSEFATFYSTAIVTLPKLLDNCTYRAFKINPQKFNKKVTDLNALEKCYIEFTDSNIKVSML